MDKETLKKAKALEYQIGRNEEAIEHLKNIRIYDDGIISIHKEQILVSKGEAEQVVEFLLDLKKKNLEVLKKEMEAL